MARKPEKEDRGDLIKPSELQIAADEWDRLQFAIDNGHGDYVERARRNFRYWLGDGGQWSDADRQYMESVQGRKCIEINGILPAVQTAVGEFIATRSDIACEPMRGQASEAVAKILSKIIKHDLNRNDYPQRARQVYKDGLIKRRGWFDVRMDFTTNVNGEVMIREVDPLTVIPDPAANSYDPSEWPGVTRLYWLTLDEIEGYYGYEAREKAEKTHTLFDENPFNDLFGTTGNRIDARYGFSPNGMDSYLPPHMDEGGEKRYRVLERQFHVMSFDLHWIDTRSGEAMPVPRNMRKEEYQKIAIENQYLLQKRIGKRVRWRVCTALSVLHDDYSPYRTFTLIPFFYLFDYGTDLGMVDNAIGPQDLHNKSLTCELHILTGVSNSGWKVPKKGDKSALTNMTLTELKSVGMSSGLVLEYDAEVGEPQKIMANAVPHGHDRLSEKGEYYVKTTTGMSDAEQGLDSPEVSGIAIQSKQFQAKMQLAESLDNMERTRKLLGRKIIELRQDFTVAEQVFTIIDTNEQTGKRETEAFTVNEVDAVGQVLNDITVGEYQIAVTSTPMAATYGENQFRQAVTLRSEAGVMIPDDELIRLSNLDNKHELADRLSNPSDNGAAAAQARLIEAKAELLVAQKLKALADATNTNIQAMFGATNAGRVLATVKGVAPLADELLLSAGFQDKNAAPLVPQPAAPAAAALPAPPVPDANTSPNFPPQADSGVTAGIEGGGMM